jgi:hypothetical protein
VFLVNLPPFKRKCSSRRDDAEVARQGTTGIKEVKTQR